MRLSCWIASARAAEAGAARVVGIVEPLLAALGAAADPECWVSWGDEPATRWSVAVPTAAGLALVNVRANVPQEGPRASGKLVRWPRVQAGELSVEAQLGHRIASATVEGLILPGADALADEIATFMLGVFAAIDGRANPPAGAAPAPLAGGPARPAAVPQGSRPK